jgi:hypothetical protein
MPIGPSRFLSLLTFPQSWDGNTLDVRFLCLPKGDPLGPLGGGALPPFATANLVLEANLIGSLDRLPLPTDATPQGVLLLDEPPAQRLDLFHELAKEFNIVAQPPSRTPVTFQKVVTDSYRALVGQRRLSPLLTEKDAFDCALHQGATDQPPDPPPPPSNAVTWGKLMALALRQPRLALGLGLLGTAKVMPSDPAFFAAGGWLYIDLHSSSDYANDNIVARYAARIPKLSIPRTIFSAVLFPVVDGPEDRADDVFHEAEVYDDGQAKLVHCVQSADTGDSVQLAWDDEQIAEWLQRQVNLAPAGDMAVDAPNGVSGYRVDVRQKGQQTWASLTGIRSLGDLQLGPFSLGAFHGEGVVEVAPAQISPNQPGLFWLPSYFATWRGSSLVLTDADLTRLHARPDVQKAAGSSPQLLDREKNFESVGDKLVPLQYGNTYEFRVRLSDLTRGGPPVTDASPEPPRNSIASIAFQRRKAPGQIEILEMPKLGSRQVSIAKPRLGYPEALFTSKVQFLNLEQDLDQLAANGTLAREIGVRDPDVLSVEVQVLVGALDGDAPTLPVGIKIEETAPARYLELYRTTRVFETPEMTLNLDFQDYPTLTTFAEVQPKDGPLALPSARPVRLTLVPIGTDQKGYFADEQSRRGQPINIDVRANAEIETELFGEPETEASLRSFFFQPPPPGNSVASPPERLAAETGLDHLALTLSGASGKRTVVACSSELRHTLSPESSTITFASASDLVQRWVNVVRFEVLRDWSWDGLEGDGITVTRIVHIVGLPDSSEIAATFRLPRAVGSKSVIGLPADVRNAVRQSTELIFFDAFDPKPKPLPAAPPGEPESPRQFPSEVTLEYVLQPAFTGLPAGDPVSRSILLPVTTPPAQTPQIVSAGIALSEYTVADDYSSTDVRRRMLWLEFAEPPVDPGDDYFVRVLAKAPDPMLLFQDELLPEVIETPLPLDPEWMRLITPGQPKDESGLSAMQSIGGRTPNAPQYMIPLPPDLDAASAELFGFFVYEVRLGHTDARWSTAQGRYGPMLRIAGVQHPAPPLICQAARVKSDVLVKAPYATPTFNGANVRPPVPTTDLWAVLYARVRQADGQAWRNVLLAQTQLFAPRAGNDPERDGIPVLYGEGSFAADSVSAGLARLGLPNDEPLTVLVAELFAEPPEANPLGSRLGQARLLRVSPLISVTKAC